MDDLIPRGRGLQKYSSATVPESNKLSSVAGSLQYVHRPLILYHRYSVASKASREPAYHSLRYDFAVFPAFHGIRKPAWGSQKLVRTSSVRVQRPKNRTKAHIPAESQLTISNPCGSACHQAIELQQRQLTIIPHDFAPVFHKKACLGQEQLCRNTRDSGPHNIS